MTPSPDEIRGREEVKLTSAQRDALEVMANAGGYVRGGKWASQSEPIFLVNTKAAFALCDLGLARMQLHDRGAFSSGYDFRITKAGKARLARAVTDLRAREEVHLPKMLKKLGSAYTTDEGDEVPTHTLYCAQCTCGWEGAAWYANPDRAFKTFRRHARHD